MVEKAYQLTAMERLFLDQDATQSMSFYEVLWSVPGDRVAVRDVLIGGAAEAIERSGSRSMRPGDLIYPQLWDPPGFVVFGNTAPLLLRPDKKAEVIELREKRRKRD